MRKVFILITAYIALLILVTVGVDQLRETYVQGENEVTLTAIDKLIEVADENGKVSVQTVEQVMSVVGDPASGEIYLSAMEYIILLIISLSFIGDLINEYRVKKILNQQS